MQRRLAWVVSAALVAAIFVLGVPSTATAATTLRLSIAEKKRLDTFLSNFSEVLLKPFASRPSDQELTRFGVGHTWINNHSLVRISGSTARVSTKVVDAATLKYFGRKVTRRVGYPAYGIRYRSGWYYFTAADGDAFPYSRSTRVLKNSDGTWTVDLTNYVAPEATQGPPRVVGTMRARLRVKIVSGRRTWTLASWLKR